MALETNPFKSSYDFKWCALKPKASQLWACFRCSCDANRLNDGPRGMFAVHGLMLSGDFNEWFPSIVFSASICICAEGRP